MAKKYRMSDVDEMIKNILYPPKPRVDRQRLLQELLDMSRGVRTPPMEEGWQEEFTEEEWEKETGYFRKRLWNEATLREPDFLEKLGIDRNRDPIRLGEIPEGYPKEQLRGLPTEAYATAYQYLGKQPEKMPWYMEPFYGKLMYPVPDLPGELEKSGLVWLASWLKDRIKKGAESVFREK